MAMMQCAAYVKWAGWIGAGMLLLLPGSSFGQVAGASLVGTVKDQTGAALPGVTVMVTQAETQLTRTTVTEGVGTFEFPSLPSGPYEVRAELAGFQTAVRRGITLAVSQQAVVDFTLGVGDVTEEVIVTGEAPLVNTTTATVAGLVSEEQVERLPLNARSFIELATLTSGVNTAETAGSSASRGFGKKIAVTGARIMTNHFMLDGTTINDTSNSIGSAAGTVAGVETIREFSVVTNAYSAEYGRHTGGVVSVITKSGTNGFRGSAYEFLRDDKFDSKTYFDDEKPSLSRHQFGYSFGGPILKNRTFFFTSFEALRQTKGQTSFFNVPNEDAHNGFLPVSGVRQFLGVDPRMKPFLDSYPLPNGRDFGDGRGELSRTGDITTNTNYVSVRVDHRLSDKDQLFGRYTRDTGRESDPVSQLNVVNSAVTNNQYLTIDETRTMSSTILNKLMFGYNRSYINGYDAPLEGMAFPLTDFTSLNFNDIVGGMTISNISAWGGGASNPRLADLRSFQFKDDLFYTRGKHSLKFGFAMEVLHLLVDGPMNGAGTYAFESLRLFMQGQVDRFTSTLPNSDARRNIRQKLIGLYAQDDIRLGSRLTLNAGMRYEFITVPTERDGKISQVRNYLDRTSKPQDTVIGDPVIENPSLKNFAPRVGLAWDVSGNGRTSIRLGTGMFYDQILPWSYRTMLYRTPPFYYIGNIFSRTLGQPIAFPNAFETQGNLLADLPQLEAIQFETKQPTVYKWSIDAQHELWGKMTLDVGYTGSRGVNLMRADFANDLINTTLPDGGAFVPNGAPFMNPNFSRIRSRTFDETSTYNALRVGVNRRFADGFQFQVSYTLGKSMDDGSSPEGAEFSNIFNTGRYLGVIERGLSAFDIRQALYANATVELPGQGLGGVAGSVLGGWSLSGILRLTAGYPFSLGAGFRNCRLQYFPCYPNVAEGVDLDSIIDSRNAEHYYDPAAFTLPAQGVQGTMERSVLIGPGIATLDGALAKDLPIGRISDHFVVQIRIEVFNILNRANFATPNRNVFNQTTRQASATAGRITEVSTSPRQAQFGVRIIF